MAAPAAALASRRAEFQNEGYVVVRQFLSAADFGELQDELHRYVTQVVPHLPEGDAFYHDRSRPETLKQMSRIENDPFFAQYIQHPAWRNLAEELLGEPATCQGTEWFNKPPATDHPTPPHQDNYYFCLQPPQVLTMWLALDTVDEENGCLRYIPGSHREGLRPHGRTRTLGFSQGIVDYSEADRAREIPILAQPNDLLIHHGNTIHRAEPNNSPTRHRRSFALVFRGASARRDDVAFHKYLDSSTAQQEALGVKNAAMTIQR
ncbi:MAG: phytanoyl-CoA dioxygenase family protein [Planctomycetaceae bacterium]